MAGTRALAWRAHTVAVCAGRPTCSEYLNEIGGRHLRVCEGCGFGRGSRLRRPADPAWMISRCVTLNARSPNVDGTVGRELERFVIRQNIERYTTMVAKATYPANRSILEKRLVEERTKLKVANDPDIHAGRLKC